MARQASLNIADYTNQETMDNLAEVLDGVIENIQTSAVSEALKNKNGSGDPEGGSVEYKRFANAELKAKGTARTAGKGDKVKAKPVIVNLDDDKEIVEELQSKDVKLYGIDGMAEKREADTKKQKNPTFTTSKWPLIKPKQNLQIAHLKDTDLFTV